MNMHEVPIHRPMGEGYRQAVAGMVRAAAVQDVSIRGSSITLDDGDVVWSCDGHRILFTIVEVAGFHQIRALTPQGNGLVTASLTAVDPTDVTTAAQTICRVGKRLTTQARLSPLTQTT